MNILDSKCCITYLHTKQPCVIYLKGLVKSDTCCYFKSFQRCFLKFCSANLKDSASHILMSFIHVILANEKKMKNNFISVKYSIQLHACSCNGSGKLKEIKNTWNSKCYYVTNPNKNGLLVCSEKKPTEGDWLENGAGQPTQLALLTRSFLMCVNFIL